MVPSTNLEDPKHTIRIVSRRTGLSSHVIRVWEKRYNAVVPSRTETNRRLYSDEDIERLQALQRLSERGHSISRIAGLTKEQLDLLLEEDRATPAPSSATSEVRDAFLARAIEAVKAQDDRLLNELTNEAAVRLGLSGVLNHFIAPLAEQTGDLWHSGEISAAHEHIATATLKSFILTHIRGFNISESAPVIVIGTPAGQLHELGAAMAAAAAAHHGWRTVYLGASLPAHEIAATVLKRKARALALSIVYPGDDPHLAMEIRTLREQLPDDFPIIAGGRCSGDYAETLAEAKVQRLTGIDDFYKALDQARAPAA